MKDKPKEDGPRADGAACSHAEKPSESEESLRDSEKRYRRLFEAARDGILILDAETGIIIDANPFLIEILGFTHKEFLGKKVWELGFFKDIAPNQDKFLELQQKGYVRYENLPLETDDGRRIDVEFVSNVYMVDHHKVIQCNIRDNTEHKAAGDELKKHREHLEELVKERTAQLAKSEEKFRTVADFTFDWEYWKGVDGAYVYNSPSCERITGYPPADFEKNPKLLEEITLPDDLNILAGHLHDGIKSKEVESIEFRITSRDGKTKWLSHTCQPMFARDGSLLGRRGSNRDITERKQFQTEYQTIVRTITDGFWITDMQGRFLDVNDAYCRLIGYARDELLKMRIQEIEAIEKSDDTAVHIRKVMEMGYDRFETCHRRKDGRTVDIEVSVNYMKIGDGRLVVLLRDITAMKKLNEDLRRRAIELEASNRELESFAYSVSHDLRAPLRTIDGFSQAILEDSNEHLDEKGKDYLQKVRSATQRMAQLIDDLLKLSRVTRADMKREQVDLSMLAREVALNLAGANPERQAEFTIQPGVAAVGDIVLLRAVMENLLGNSWKFTSKHPSVKIDFGKTERDGKTVYYVRDDGAGFDPKYADKLFAPFQRLHSTSEFRGTGIGLATIQRIIHRHGGRVWAEGEVEKGATFYFTLD